MKRKNLVLILWIVVLPLCLFIFLEARSYHKLISKFEFQAQLAADAKDFCISVANAFVSGDPNKINESLYKSDDVIIEHIDAYSDIRMIYDDINFIGKTADAEGTPCTCVIRYRLLSDIPAELNETISLVVQEQDTNYIFQTISYIYDKVSNRWYYWLVGYDIYQF